MLKRLLIILLLIGVVIASGVAASYFYFKPDKERVLTFIKENPEKASIKLIRNDSLLADLQSDRVMPLASTVKIIIAIEYAEQAAAGRVDSEELIALEALEKFYVPDTDGGAHPGWKKAIKGKTVNDSIPLKEVVKGMLKFSSNANTEWLCDRLGLENINSRLDSLGIEKHTEIYYIVSALFAGQEKFPELEGRAQEEALRALTDEEYIELTHEIHAKMAADTAYRKSLGSLKLNLQKVWSDRLPASTTAEYAGLMEKINSKEYFDPQTQTYLDEVMEWILDNPANRAWLQHSGMKGGSTVFVLTKALYATDKKGNTTELAYFLNDLEPMEITRLRFSLNEFELNILQNPAFCKRVEQVLNK